MTLLYSYSHVKHSLLMIGQWDKVGKVQHSTDVRELKVFQRGCNNKYYIFGCNNHIILPVYVKCKYSKLIGQFLVTRPSVMVHTDSKYYIDQSIFSNIDCRHGAIIVTSYCTIYMSYCTIYVILYYLCHIVLFTCHIVLFMSYCTIYMSYCTIYMSYCTIYMSYCTIIWQKCDSGATMVSDVTIWHNNSSTMSQTVE